MLLVAIKINIETIVDKHEYGKQNGVKKTLVAF